MTKTESTECVSCQVEASVLAGTATQQERNHWSLFGCTCDPEDAAEANAWFQSVTR